MSGALFTVVGYHDDRDLEHFVRHVTVKPGGDPWRAALAAEARERRDKRGDGNARVRHFIEYATEVVTFPGHLEQAP